MYYEAYEKSKSLLQNKYNVSMKNKYYESIKALFEKLYTDKVINRTDKTSYLDIYYNDIFNKSRDAYTVYKEALKKHDVLKEECLNRNRNIIDYNINTKNNNRYNQYNNDIFINFDDNFDDNFDYNFDDNSSYIRRYFR